MSAEPPRHLQCPLTHALMASPVSAPDGYTYEKKAILEWLRDHSTSPMTRAPMDSSNLTVNRAIRDAIEEWCSQNGVPVPNPDAGASSPPAPPPPRCSLKFRAHRQAVTGSLFFSVSPEKVGPTGWARAPVSAITVLDISGSMGSLSSMGGQELSLTRLDLVRHAAKTVAHTLGSADRFGIVTFDNKATLNFPLTRMDAEGQAAADEVIERIRTEGATNIWAGLRTALDNLVTEDPQRPKFVLLLTDGQPNQRPSRPEQAAMEAHIKRLGLHGVSVSSLAFGFNEIDTILLDAIAKRGQGGYTYIPDGGFIGTVFCSAVANMLRTAAMDVFVEVRAAGGGSLSATDFRPLAVSGGAVEGGDGWIRIPVEAVGYGEERRVFCELSVTAGAAASGQLRARVRYVPVGAESGAEVVGEEMVIGSLAESGEGGSPPVPVGMEGIRTETDEETEMRSWFAELVRELVGEVMPEEFAPPVRDPHTLRQSIGAVRTPRSAASLREEKREAIETLLTSRGGVEGGGGPISALLQDLKGEVKMAVQEEHFGRWGRHYLSSLASAHRRQERNNFKDPGVQRYGGGVFRELYANASDLFDLVEMPTPAMTRSGGRGPSGGIVVTNMSQLNSVDNPCVHGASRVLMGDGTEKRADMVRKGDAVRLPSGASGRVALVVHTLVQGGVAKLCKIGERGLRVTPYHPVSLRVQQSDEKKEGGDTSGLAFFFPKDGDASSREEVVRVESQAGGGEFACPPELLPCEGLFSFMLEPLSEGDPAMNAAVCTDGVWVIALGHGDKTDPVLSHPLWAEREKVAAEVEKCAPGALERGEIVFLPFPVQRDADGLAKFLDPSKAVQKGASAFGAMCALASGSGQAAQGLSALSKATSSTSPSAHLPCAAVSS